MITESLRVPDFAAKHFPPNGCSKVWPLGAAPSIISFFERF